jgi:hypothetical protein
MANLDEKIVFEPTGFDYVNPKAEVVIVGITPGNSQLDGSRDGMSPREIKRKYAFAGSMRHWLVNMLDYIGINQLLNIGTCSSLWGDDFDKVEMTSLLKDATYEIKKDGSREMFRHASKIEKSKKLTRMLEDGFVKNCGKYENSVLFVACGPGVYDILKKLQNEKKIEGLVAGIAHPSGANLGRILCYMGQKEPMEPSYYWCVEKAEEAKSIVSSLKLHRSRIVHFKK